MDRQNTTPKTSHSIAASRGKNYTLHHMRRKIKDKNSDESHEAKPAPVIDFQALGYKFDVFRSKLTAFHAAHHNYPRTWEQN